MLPLRTLVIVISFPSLGNYDLLMYVCEGLEMHPHRNLIIMFLKYLTYFQKNKSLLEALVVYQHVMLDKNYLHYNDYLIFTNFYC